MGSDAAADSLPRLHALSRVHFIPVSSVREFRLGGLRSFSPLFCHHFFPSEEKIVGFDSVQVRLYFTATCFDLFVQIEGRVSPKAPDAAAVKRGLLDALLKQVPFPGPVCKTPEDFEKKIEQVNAGLWVASLSPPKDSATVEAVFFSANLWGSARSQGRRFSPPGRVRAQSVLGSVEESADSGEGRARQAVLSSKASSQQRVLLLQLRECRFSSTPEGRRFADLHRKVEWFLHWFIESASAIHPDPQWSVLLPYLVEADAGAPSFSLLPAVRKRVAELKARGARSGDGCLLGRPLTEAAVAEAEGRGESFSALPVFAAYADAAEALAAEDELRRDSDSSGTAKAEGNTRGASSRKTSSCSGASQSKKRKRALPETAESDFQNEHQEPAMKLLKARPSAAASSSKETPPQLQPGGLSASGSSKTAAKAVVVKGEGGCDASKDGGVGNASFSLAGIVTLYTFYSLTGYRRRLSQCLVFPHVQSKGVGMRTLEFVYHDLILDARVTEFTVEDPASSFSQLRDVVCLKVALDCQVLSPKLLFPAEAPDGSEKDASVAEGVGDKAVCDSSAERPAQASLPEAQAHSAAPLSLSGLETADAESAKRRVAATPDAECFRRLLKETRAESVRLAEVLALAAVLPDPPPQPFPESSSFSSRRDWRRSAFEAQSTENADCSEGRPAERETLHQHSPTAADLAASPTNSSASGDFAKASTSGLSKQAAQGFRPPQVRRSGGSCAGRAADSGGNANASPFHCSSACAAVRLRVKQRLRLAAYDLLSELPPQQHKMELRYQWEDTYAKYFRQACQKRRRVK